MDLHAAATAKGFRHHRVRPEACLLLRFGHVALAGVLGGALKPFVRSGDDTAGMLDGELGCESCCRAAHK